MSALFNRQISSVEQALGVKDITTPQMGRAIQEWFGLYFDTEQTEESDPSQRIPYQVVNKLTKTVFSEYTATVDDEFMKRTLEELNRAKKKAMQLGLIGGSCYIKPIPAGDRFTFALVRRDCYLVLERDESGKATSIASAEETAAGGKYYTLIEKRTVDHTGRLTVENRLYRSETKGVIGTQVPLTTLPKYGYLTPEMTFPEPLHGLGMALLKTPMVNCVDGSDDAVSVYAPAAGLIRNINRNEAQINGEFKRGESRIIVSSDLMRRDEEGKASFPDHVFTGIDDDPDGVGITIFSPAFREQSFFSRNNKYLRSVESQIGLKRGIISEVEAVERTATEVTSSEGDYNLTIIDFQQAWEEALRETVRICAALGHLYQIYPSKTFDQDGLVVDWGDGVLYNRDKVWQEYKEMVASRMLKAELALAWYFNLPCETPGDVEKIRNNYMPELEAMMGGD